MGRETKMIRIGIIVAVIATATAGVVVRAGTPPPARMGYAGSLSMASGPAPDGIYVITFGLYPDATSTTSLWTETHTDTSVVTGRFYVELGGVTALPAVVFDGSERWLEIRVGSEVLAPRQRLSSVPYAIQTPKLVCRSVEMTASIPACGSDVLVACAADETITGGTCGERGLFAWSFPDNITLKCSFNRSFTSGCGMYGPTPSTVQARCCKVGF
jgi:hypothetical protein